MSKLNLRKPESKFYIFRRPPNGRWRCLLTQKLPEDKTDFIIMGPFNNLYQCLKAIAQNPITAK